MHNEKKAREKSTLVEDGHRKLDVKFRPLPPSLAAHRSQLTGNDRAKDSERVTCTKREQREIVSKKPPTLTPGPVILPFVIEEKPFEEERPMSAMNDAFTKLKRFFELEEMINAYKLEQEQLVSELNENPEVQSVAKKLGWKVPKSPSGESGEKRGPGRPMNGTLRNQVYELTSDEPINYKDIAEKLGIKKDRAYTELLSLSERKMVEKTAPGMFKRTASKSD